MALAISTAACTHDGFGSVAGHFAAFEVPQPKGTTVYVCHAYGCRMRTKFHFTDKDVADLAALMGRYRTTADTAEEERRAIAYAIGWMETRTGDVIGTKDDRPGMDFMGAGDPTQQDCVDEATNTTSYMTVLVNSGLIHHHTVTLPFAKDNFLKGVAGWTHWTAVLVENANNQRWAVDSWIYANGENPAIVKADEWYISTLDDLPKPTK